MGKLLYLQGSNTLNWSANLVAQISRAPIILGVTIKWLDSPLKRWRLYSNWSAISPILVRNFVTIYDKMMNYWKNFIFYRKSRSDYIFICYVDVLIICFYYGLQYILYDNKIIRYIHTDSCFTLHCKTSGHFILIEKTH